MLLEIQPRILIFLLSSIGLITFPHIWHVPVPIFAFFAVLLSWRFICVWKTHWLPHKLVTFLITLSSFGLLFSQYRSVLGRDAGTSLFVIALALKLLEIKQERDLYLITYLAFIVASSQFLYEQSIIMGLYILVVCCVLLATLVTINSQQPQTLASLKKSAVIILQALPITIVLFVLFPRVEAPRWSFFKNNNDAKLGLSENLEPGSISRLGISRDLVFRVKFSGEIPPPEELYWRGPAYSYTDGKRWKAAHHSFSNASYMDTPTFEGADYQYQLMMEPQNKNWVFALDLPAKFPHNLRRTSNHQLVTDDDYQKRNEYQITSFADYNTGYITKT